FTLLNIASSMRSYAIFNAPPTIKGQPNGDSASSQPAISGLTADARLRGTAVIEAAAGRSAGVTTAITYELRVGTSICDSALRISNSAIAQPAEGMNGTRISSTDD